MEADPHRACLNGLGLDEPDRMRWTRHGSTRWLWKPESVSAAIRYVVDEQGEQMAVLEAKSLEDRFLSYEGRGSVTTVAEQPVMTPAPAPPPQFPTPARRPH